MNKDSKEIKSEKFSFCKNNEQENQNCSNFYDKNVFKNGINSSRIFSENFLNDYGNLDMVSNLVQQFYEQIQNYLKNLGNSSSQKIISLKNQMNTFQIEIQKQTEDIKTLNQNLQINEEQYYSLLRECNDKKCEKFFLEKQITKYSNLKQIEIKKQNQENESFNFQILQIKNQPLQGINQLNNISKEIFESQEILLKKSKIKRCPSSEMLLEENNSIKLDNSTSNYREQNQMNQSNVINTKKNNRKQQFEQFEQFMNTSPKSFLRQQRSKRNSVRQNLQSQFNKSKFSNKNDCQENFENEGSKFQKMTNNRVDEIIQENKDLNESKQRLLLANKEIEKIIESTEEKNVQLVKEIEKQKVMKERLDNILLSLKKQYEETIQKKNTIDLNISQTIEELENLKFKFKSPKNSQQNIRTQKFDQKSFQKIDIIDTQSKNSNVTVNMWINQMIVNIKNIQNNIQFKESLNNIKALYKFLFDDEEQFSEYQSDINNTDFHNQSLLLNNQLTIKKNDSQLDSLNISKSSNYKFKNSITKFIKDNNDQSLASQNKNYTREEIFQSNITDLFMCIVSQQWEYLQIITYFIKSIRFLNKKIYREIKQETYDFWNRRKNTDKFQVKIFQKLFEENELEDTIKKLQCYIQGSKTDLTKLSSFCEKKLKCIVEQQIN